MREVRSHRSQAWIAIRMKQTVSQISKWENERTNVAWHSWVHLCRVCGVDLVPILKATLNYDGPADRSDLLCQFFSSINDKKAYRVWHSTTWWAWQKGKREPSLAHMLLMMDQIGLSEEFLGTFLTPRVAKKKTCGRWKHRVYRLPYLGAVSAALELDDCPPKHRPGWIASRTGITKRQERAALTQLQKTGLIRWNGTRFEPSQGHIDTTTATNAERIQYQRIRRYWSSRYFDKLRQGIQAGHHSYRVMAASDVARQKIWAKVLSFYHEVDEILTADCNRKTSVCHIGIDLARLSELGGSNE